MIGAWHGTGVKFKVRWYRLAKPRVEGGAIRYGIQEFLDHTGRTFTGAKGRVGCSVTADDRGRLGHGGLLQPAVRKNSGPVERHGW